MRSSFCYLAFLLNTLTSQARAAPPVDENSVKAGGTPPQGGVAVQGAESQVNPATYEKACPDYTHYSRIKHRPLSDGPLSLPSQRPSTHCRTFESPLVEKVIEDIVSRMKDHDLAQIFSNAFPNTLDTTVRWHTDGSSTKTPRGLSEKDKKRWKGAQSFIVTGDINAEWLRDSTNQLAQYQRLANKDAALQSLILGAINTQAEYVIESPYCNAFQPPPPSGLQATDNGMQDVVHPAYEPSFVFECKYELDSLAHFLSLANQFYNHTGSTVFLDDRFYTALNELLHVLDEQSEGTFNNKTGQYHRSTYTFKRHAWLGTETLNLDGIGNPLASGTGLIRSAFRPSDDATIFGYFIPANAMMSVELRRTGLMLQASGGPSKQTLAKNLLDRASALEAAIFTHGTYTHPVYGEVFAYEVDGYGSQLSMDDANIPSLLSLPLLGFVESSSKIYQNTRSMILSRQGNPYYLSGSNFHGIGGPHIGVENAWPMSLLVQAMTSSDSTEILKCLNVVKEASRLGLVHESIHVNRAGEYTRSWFAWANAVFAQTILDLAERMPEVLFGEGASSWKVDDLL
ncbi:hypothetical protein UCRPC4_g03846 [Phaeomoniella chlamydospora]|uniref:Duf1237 domain protein n=1 Tax=Phaeomoniella chlamydospora TaxID=158046 RepID=A0A0G2GWT9_PHACM|nr:hypothetical protein UCRPC4_g03846 [Phaeomoniella chlamydospora]